MKELMMERRNNEHNIIITLQRATLWLRTDTCFLGDLPVAVEPQGRKENERINELHTHTHTHTQKHTHTHTHTYTHTHLLVLSIFHHCAVASEFLLASTYNLLEVVIL